jgi:putative sterol carrier protein
MPPDQLDAFFRTSDIVEITEIIRSASDDELRALIEIEHFREEGVVAILDRFEEFADADRLAEISGVVRFELTRSAKEIERHTARFTSGKVELEDGGTPDVTICADIVDFVRLVTGQSNAALLYLGGRLGIEGDEMLALAVGSVFTVPGSNQAAVDPTALDPVDVATAVASSSSRHMRAVMEGGFRPIVLGEVFRRFPDFIDVGKARDLKLCVGFRVGGRRDGGVDRYVVRVAGGSCTVETDPPEGQRRDATITLDGADFLRLVTGQLHPVRGVLTGAMKVKGDRGKALALNAVMVPPQPRA